MANPRAAKESVLSVGPGLRGLHAASLLLRDGWEAPPKCLPLAAFDSPTYRTGSAPG